MSASRGLGVQGRRQSREIDRRENNPPDWLILAVHTAASDIRAVELAPDIGGDSPLLEEVLEQIPDVEEIGTVTADGPYDTRRRHTDIIDRQATAFGPSF